MEQKIFNSDASRMKRNFTRMERDRNFESYSWLLRSVDKDYFLHISHVSRHGYRIYPWNLNYRNGVAAVCMI